MKVSKTYLNEIHFSVGQHEVKNDDLCKKYTSYTPEKILKESGVKTRYHSKKGELSSDLAQTCGKQFFDFFNFKRDDVDFLIFCTEGPDYIAPATSCIVQKKLNLPTSIGTLDLAFGCSGYTYSLLQAKALIESGIANNVIVITADIPSQVVAEQDIYLNFIFSDAASLSWISRDHKGYEIGNFAFGTDGSGERNLYVSNSTFNEPKDIDWYNNQKNLGLPVGRMVMKGEAIFKFSIREVPKLVDQILNKNNLDFESVDLFIFHQASRIILKSIQKKLKIDDAKFFSILASYGNTVSATIPIALSEAKKQGKITPGMNILIAGFGIGYSWSGTIIKT